jgi:cation transport ATPase
MRETDSPARSIDGFEVMPGGGLKGVIEGHVVLCGSTDLMRLMNVRIPFRLTDKTTVLLAIDGILYGIFSLKYEGQPQIRRALLDLMRAPHPPVFAVRDFNVNPEMLHATFDISTDGYDFPPYVERFAISEARISDDSKIAAVVCREGLGPLVHMADTGRSMYMATRINLLVTLLSAVIGVILVFVRLLTVGTIGAGFLLLYMLVWALPVFVVSFLLRF